MIENTIDISDAPNDARNEIAARIRMRMRDLVNTTARDLVDIRMQMSMDEYETWLREEFEWSSDDSFGIGSWLRSLERGSSIYTIFPGTVVFAGSGPNAVPAKRHW